MSLPQPTAILLLSGKRKSGKDYVASTLEQQLGDNQCDLVKLSNAIKREYASLHGLDYKEMLSDSPYKDRYRREMISLGEERRARDPGHYCKLACEGARPCIVWVVTDTRRESDMAWFKEHYSHIPLLTVRVTADPGVRCERGWRWTEGVDNVESECGLDSYNHDIVVENSGKPITPYIQQILQWVSKGEMNI